MNQCSAGTPLSSLAPPRLSSPPAPPPYQGQGRPPVWLLKKARRPPGRYTTVDRPSVHVSSLSPYFSTHCTPVPVNILAEALAMSLRSFSLYDWMSPGHGVMALLSQTQIVSATCSRSRKS